MRIVLTSRFAMWMGWGPDLTFFYNDAYARMTLGKKHPWALGRTAREVWAEIWRDIGPRIERVIETGAELRVESVVGKGSVFTLALRRRDDRNREQGTVIPRRFPIPYSRFPTIRHAIVTSSTPFRNTTMATVTAQ